MEMRRQQLWICAITDRDRRPKASSRLIITGPLVKSIDFELITISGMAIWHYAAPLSDYPATGQIALLGASAGFLAITYRRLGHDVDALVTKAIQGKLLVTATSTAAAVYTVILFCWLLLPMHVWNSLDGWTKLWALTAILSSVALYFFVAVAARRSGAATRVVVIAVRDHADSALKLISKVEVSNEVVRYYDDEDLTPLVMAAKDGRVDILLLAMSDADSSHIGRICGLFMDIPIRVCLAIDPTSLGGAPQRTPFNLVDLAVPPPALWVAFLKRLVDIFGSCIALILSMPVLFIAVIAIRLETGGSVIFRQWRSGRAGRPFEVLKLRTMHIQSCDPSGERQTSRQDPRITRVGRLLRRSSIDEIPQLINVLRGEMSLVGPRAHPIHMKVEGRSFADAVRNYHARHRIKPGITGWAQVNGSRGSIEEIAGAQRRVELDLFYVHNQSIMFDFYIIIRTICGGFIAAK